VHHRSSGPPLAARVAGALTRRPFPRARSRRLLLAGVLTTTVTALVLALPVLSRSGSGSSSVVLSSSSSGPATPSTDSGPLVVMGVDGRPAPASASPSVDPEASAVPEPSASAATSAGGPAGAAGRPSPAASSGLPGSAEGSPSSAGPSPSGGPMETSSPVPGTPEATPEAAAPSVVPAEPDSVTELVARLDEARAAASCDALTPDAALAAVAQAHSTAMRDEGFFGLLGADGTSLLEHGARAAAVARGNDSPADVVSTWLTDPTVAAAIGDCTLVSAGIGRAEGADGPWWTLLLA
jgi:uncharacterized protein YkwD